VTPPKTVYGAYVKADQAYSSFVRRMLERFNLREPTPEEREEYDRIIEDTYGEKTCGDRECDGSLCKDV
jgi:hypothetical protein